MAKAGRTEQRTTSVLSHIMKAYEIIFPICFLFNINRTFGSHDMVIYTSQIKLMRNKQINLIDSHNDCLFFKTEKKYLKYRPTVIPFL